MSTYKIIYLLPAIWLFVAVTTCAAIGSADGRAEVYRNAGYHYKAEQQVSVGQEKSVNPPPKLDRLSKSIKLPWFFWPSIIFIGVVSVLTGGRKNRRRKKSTSLPPLFNNRWNDFTPEYRRSAENHSRQQNPLPSPAYVEQVNPSPCSFVVTPESGKEWSTEILNSLEWKRFETICAEYLRLIGYDSRETRIGADGGVDIRIYKPWEEGSDAIVQCKAWNTYRVGVKPLRELYGVMAAEGISHGLFMTSSEFTSEAINFAKGKKLELYSGMRLLNEIKNLPEQWQKGLLDVAMEGDYSTPTCPQCGVKMSLRRGSARGKNFWGCPRYPRCRATLAYKEN